MAVNAGLLILMSDALITQILEEYRSWQAGSGGMVLTNGAKWDKKSKQFGGTKGKCSNCGKKSHWVKDCWEPGGDKEGQAPKWWKYEDKAKQTQE